MGRSRWFQDDFVSHLVAKIRWLAYTTVKIVIRSHFISPSFVQFSLRHLPSVHIWSALRSLFFATPVIPRAGLIFQYGYDLDEFKTIKRSMSGLVHIRHHSLSFISLPSSSRGRTPFGQHQESRALERSNFLCMRRVIVSY